MQYIKLIYKNLKHTKKIFISIYIHKFDKKIEGSCSLITRQQSYYNNFLQKLEKKGEQ
ncbi:hypothetical protein pb186bvf_014170 [Paramecium bursaria]